MLYVFCAGNRCLPRHAELVAVVYRLFLPVIVTTSAVRQLAQPVSRVRGHFPWRGTIKAGSTSAVARSFSLCSRYSIHVSFPGRFVHRRGLQNPIRFHSPAAPQCDFHVTDPAALAPELLLCLCPIPFKCLLAPYELHQQPDDGVPPRPRRSML